MTDKSPHQSIKQFESKPVYDYRVAIKVRFQRALNYLSIYAFVLVIYGGAALAEYLLFGFLWLLVSDDAGRYPIVAQALDLARIGLALVFISAAVVHGLMSTYHQVMMDIKLSREE